MPVMAARSTDRRDREITAEMSRRAVRAKAEDTRPRHTYVARGLEMLISMGPIMLVETRGIEPLTPALQRKPVV
jgi:hypothetical protein